MRRRLGDDPSKIERYRGAQEDRFTGFETDEDIENYSPEDFSFRDESMKKYGVDVLPGAEDNTRTWDDERFDRKRNKKQYEQMEDNERRKQAYVKGFGKLASAFSKMQTGSPYEHLKGARYEKVNTGRGQDRMAARYAALQRMIGR